MSSKKLEGYPMTTQIQIQIDQQVDFEKNDETSNNNNNVDNKSKSKQPKTPWNKFKKFDKQKREKVIFWCKLATFLVAASTCVASFTVPSLRKAQPRGIVLWQWSLLLTVLLGGPLVSKGIVHFVRLFLDDRGLSAKENVIYYVLGLIESAWVSLWFSMVLIAWLMVVDEPSYLGMPRDKGKTIIKKFSTTFPIINVTLITIILGSILWLLKELVLMKGKSSFHIRRFFDRIREALMHQCVVEGLSSSDDDHNVMICDDGGTNTNFVKRKKIGNKEKSIIDMSCFDNVTQENVSCWGMKQVIDWMMENPYLTYNYKKDNDGSKDVVVVIETKVEASIAANSIFKSLFPNEDEHSHIGCEVLEMRRFPKDKLSDVKKCLLQGAESSEINKEVFRKWMVKAHLMRSSLARALVANKKLFKALNKFINVLLIFFIFALWLIMIRIETRKVIFFIGSVIAGSAFIFGETCKKILENLLFVFLVHPFDIGDCCLIENIPVIIEEITVLSTTALTIDNEIKHYSNTALSSQTISNYTRSKDMGDMIEFPIEASTSIETIDRLKIEVDRYIKENLRHWFSEHYWVMEMEDTSTIKMKLHFQHTINYHDFKERQIRKSKLFSKIKQIHYELTTTKKDCLDQMFNNVSIGDITATTHQLLLTN